ncbi:5-formyltetrahydrofolate cyclo-ligase [Thelephora ganbajun]|uniref:5-formyltetrahydrofolate cyclo-ligase n=1 Tax=Thelephora ganbajun TaxID=370292 RepID=A0ACB6ZTA9_THEGA|nr:5-formyltetrahydrofolate cyclo-ligase [Thelephora ganbajun]
MATTAIQGQKRALRKIVSASLKSLSQSQIQHQSKVVTDAIVNSTMFQTSKCISCYLSMPKGELDTGPLVSAILAAGKILYVPKLDTSDSSHPRMDMLRVYDQSDLDSFPSGLWGIREPPYERSRKPRSNALDADQQLDLIIVPGVAFDTSMGRLGHGKGYYDSFITEYIANTGRSRPFLVALALNEQVLQEQNVPMISGHDWSMDCIVRSDGILDPNNLLGCPTH